VAVVMAGQALAWGSATGVADSASSIPQPSASMLNGVTCTAPKNCWAVGTYNKTKNQALHWNGVTWSLIPTPNRHPSQQQGLNAVACASSQNCWAVGGDASGDEILHWNGSRWSFVSTPNLDDANGTPEGSTLKDVDCVSTRDCWAVGWQRDKVNGYITNVSDVIHWDGSGWSLLFAPSSLGSNLAGIACITGEDCWAVGGHCCGGRGYNLNQTIHWDGYMWSAVPAAEPAHEYPLSSLACVSWKNCWAVGGSGANEVLKWNGRKWSAARLPHLGGGDGLTGLASVSCAGLNQCWAVGAYNQNSGPQASAEVLHWNGSTWTRARVPQSSVSPLSGIDCTSSSNCWAVGNYNGNKNQVLHWNGRKWSR
jgi:hypothetical protein